jgi:hypothetical protein
MTAGESLPSVLSGTTVDDPDVKQEILNRCETGEVEKPSQGLTTDVSYSKYAVISFIRHAQVSICRIFLFFRCLTSMQ